MAASPLSLATLRDADLVASGHRVFEIERDELDRVGGRIGTEFAAACRLVSKTWRCLVAVLQGLFLHAAQNLARETDRIVFVHPFDNTLDQRAERTVDQWL